MTRAREYAKKPLNLSDMELLALVEACNVTNRHVEETIRPWSSHGHDARLKLMEEVFRRSIIKSKEKK